MATPCFYLNVTIRGYDAEVFLNGAPILSAVRAYSCIALPPVSEWVVEGENVLSVVVEGGDHIDPPPEDGSEDGEQTTAPPPPRPGEEPLLRVALCRGELGEIVEPGQENELVALEWVPPPRGADEPPLELPHEEHVTIDLSHPWGTWAWESAPAFDFETDPTAVLDIIRFLADLHAALAAGRLDPLLDASRVKFDEVAPCYDMDPGQARARLGAAWPEITKPAGWQLAPFDESDLDLRLCCGGRVIEPRTLFGEPVLRQAEELDEQRWTMPLFVAHVGGQLAIVR
jgi:hypothetical protein